MTGELRIGRELVTFQHPRGDYQALNFAGAFVNLGDAGVAIGAFDGIFAAVAVAAVNLDGFVGDARGHFARKKFRDRRFHGKARAGILLPGRATQQQARRVNFRGHIRQHELNRLKIGDGMAECLALLRVAQGGFERALRDSGGLRGDADAAAIEGGKRDFISFAFGADAIGGGHFAIA